MRDEHKRLLVVAMAEKVIANNDPSLSCPEITQLPDLDES
ncbi:hypothetical protein CHELA1G2_11859 [Hyphomicrobiales bacterium]|nr:hypothetical protein CHELA1G2_11859 [Hyphomicrobiales bacterium]